VPRPPLRKIRDTPEPQRAEETTAQNTECARIAQGVARIFRSWVGHGRDRAKAGGHRERLPSVRS
jgi:hypothetical protein